MVIDLVLGTTIGGSTWLEEGVDDDIGCCCDAKLDEFLAGGVPCLDLPPLRGQASLRPPNASMMPHKDSPHSYLCVALFCLYLGIAEHQKGLRQRARQ